MQLIVAEKPSVARDLARVLGVRASGQHAFEGDGVVITWCVGHLVELEEPAAYDPRWKAWRLDTLPMLPPAFRLRPARHAMAQLRAVAKLLARCTSVVNACDAGREGELIFRYVYQYAGGGPPVRRLWISSLTDEAIRRGFAALRPGAQLDALGDAARSRSEADWLVGMNATRAITARGRAAGHTALYSIGRVQTPTLAMLVAREHAIRAFVPRPYWELRGDFTTSDGQRFSAGWRRGGAARVAHAAIADAIVARDTAAAAGPHGPRVERLRARTTREPAPLLFDLTALQRTANKRFGFSAARTLELAQALYERHKLLTYPRTDARHLSSDVVSELPAVFAALAAVPDYAAFAQTLLATPPRPGRRIVDDTKVHDHHAIIPTTTRARLDALDRDERRLFDLVARRFLAAFYPDAEFAITEAWIRVGAAIAGAPAPAFTEPHGGDRETRGAGGPGRESRGGGDPRGDARAIAEEPPILDQLPPLPDRYLARGRVRLAAGWQAVAGIDGDAARSRDGEHGRDEPPLAVLPPLVEGQPLAGRFASIAKHTTPPPRYSEATLLGAMESAGKAIDDETLRLAMKDCGLGTPATRAAVIETLLKRDYIVRTKQQLAPTALGISLIDSLPVTTLASPELTGAWEARLARIARGEDSRAAFMADIARYVTEMVDAIRGSAAPTAPVGSPPPVGSAAPVGRCPRCSSPVIEQPRAFTCTGSCGFTMRNRVAGRAIAAALAGVLLAHRKSQVLRGFRSKAGKPFAAALMLSDDGELGFDFDHGDRAAAPDRAPPADGAVAPPRAAAVRRDPGSPRRRSTSQPTVESNTGSLARTKRRSDGAPAKRSARAAAAPTAIGELACPRCHHGRLIAGSRGWGCSRWRDGCRFVVWFETAGRQLSVAQLRELVTRGKTRKARFRSERGIELDGRLVLDPAADGGGARLEPA